MLLARLERFALAASILALQAVGTAQDWPQWRGPNRDGVTSAFNAPAAWPQALRQQWKVTVGIGHSSPLVVGTRVYVHARQAEREVLSTFDLASGKLLWADSLAVPYEMNPAAASHGKGPKSTPVLADGIVCTLGISGTLSCLDAGSGKLHWRKTFTGEFPHTSAFYGTAMSPLIDNGLVIAHIGGPDKGALRAFDTKTGVARWSWDGDAPAYASPVIFTASGVRQVVTLTSRFIAGVGAATGELLWKVPFTTAYDQNAVTPLIYKDTIIISGIDKGILAIRPVKGASGWTAARVWENSTSALYMSSPVVTGDLLFAFSHKNKGQIVCSSPATGAELWKTEGRQGDNAALVAAGGLLFVLTNEAQLMVVRGNAKQFAPIRRYDVGESPTWAHPVVLNTGVIIKDETSLALWTFN